MQKRHLSVFLIAGLTAIFLFYLAREQANEYLSEPTQGDGNVASVDQENTLSQVTEGKEAVSVESDSSKPLANSPAPQRHADVLELSAMAENFDFHFNNLIDRGQQQSAAQLLLHKSRLNDWHGDERRAFLERHLKKYPDLLQDQELATEYVIHYGMGIDKDKYNAHLSLLERYHPYLVEGLEICYETYRDLTWDSTPVPSVEEKVTPCLTSAETLASPPKIVDGVIEAYFRSYLIKVYGLEAAIRRAREMRQDFPALIDEETKLFYGYINLEEDK